MSLFDRVFDKERLMFLAACAGIIDDSGKADEYMAESNELGAVILAVIDESFDSAEKIVFCSTLIMLIDEILQDESDDAWDRCSKAVIEDQIGGGS